MQKPFQRIGDKSNGQVGREFELVAQSFFASQGVELTRGYKLKIGLGERKKIHSFDLGSIDKKWIVECKSHKWTTGNIIPSAKMSVWNEAMYYFHIAPPEYTKIMFVLHDLNAFRNESLVDYYIKTHGHLIPHDVEFWEYFENSGTAIKTSIFVENKK